MKCGDLIFTHGSGIISGIIKWWSHSHWSHVRIAIASDAFIEATWPRVRIGYLSEITDKCIIKTPITPLTEEDQAGLIDFLYQQLGKRYDWRGLFSFLVRKNVSNKNWFYCNELAEEAYIAINRKLVGGDPSWHTPDDTFNSLLLKAGE